MNPLKFYIYDFTCNTGKPFVNAGLDSVETHQEARSFDTQEAAQKEIDAQEWNGWAKVVER